MRQASVAARNYSRLSNSFEHLARYILNLRKLLAVTAILVAGLAATAAQADSCAALRSQLHASGKSSGSAEIAQLTRQIAAIRGLERQRQCSSSRSFLLFNACGELAKRRAEAERQLNKAKLGRSGAGAEARLAALGCGVAPQRQAKSRRSVGQSYSGTAMLFCVRLADGYYFPAPNSQFVNEAAYDNTLDRCRYICDEPAMDVYRLDSGDLETEQMVSVRGRRPYTELAGAFAYRQSSQFRSCDLARYSRRVDEARARSVTPDNMSDVIIPVPTLKPVMVSYPDVANLPSSTGSDLPVSAYSGETGTRRVRIVGAPFLPEP